MMPDYQKAAIKATETLIKHKVSSAPVAPSRILKETPGVLLLTYEALSNDVGMERKCLMPVFGENNQDAFTSVNIIEGEKQYLVTYNQRLSTAVIQRALARELGHIVLEHDGTKPEDVRNEEAKCFAHHLLCPRPLIHAIQAANIRLTVELLGNTTCCYDFCLNCMRRMPGVNVPPELNQLVRDQFMDYFVELFNYQRVASIKDTSAVADLGTFMDGYEE